MNKGQTTGQYKDVSKIRNKLKSKKFVWEMWMVQRCPDWHPQKKQFENTINTCTYSSVLHMCLDSWSSWITELKWTSKTVKKYRQQIRENNIKQE